MQRRTEVRYTTVMNLIFAAFLAVTILSGCGGRSDREDVKRPVVEGITVNNITPVQVDDIYEAAGTVRADRTSIVASRVMGVVTSVLVREGDSVKTGQLLMTIDDKDTVQRVRSSDMTVEVAKQNKALAEATWRRYRNLYEEKALSRQEMDQVETQKKVAEAEYERARSMAAEARAYQSFTKVTAPASGRITEKRIDAGSMASPGMPLLIIEGGEGVFIETAVDESLLNKVKKGMNVDVLIEKQNVPVPGTVRDIVPAVDPLSRTFIIKVGMKDVRPQSGRFARVRIKTGVKEALLVPGAAIIRKGQLTGVYAVDSQGVITYRLIRAGIIHAGGTEVLSGLGPRDRIVTGGVEKAIDGAVIAGVKKGE